MDALPSLSNRPIIGKRYEKIFWPLPAGITAEDHEEEMKKKCTKI